jgi:hypothetical protein
MGFESVFFSHQQFPFSAERGSGKGLYSMEEAFLISLPTDAVVLIIYATGSLIWPGCGRVRVSIELLPQLNLHGPTTQHASNNDHSA